MACPTFQHVTIEVLRRLLVLVVVLIVYGSLYPWHFVPPDLTANPFWILLHSSHEMPFRYLLRDIIVNISLYIPLGFAGHLAFRQSRWPAFSIYAPVLLGLLLSTTMELTQLLVPTRDTSIADVVTNVIGSGIGVMLGLVFEAIVARNRWPSRTRNYRVADRGALILAFCWAAWLLFPLFPALNSFELSRRLALFEHSRLFDPVPLVSAAASWYAAGLLLTAAARVPPAWLALTLLVIPSQFLIADRQPLPSLLLGAIVGVVLFLARHRSGAPSKAEAWVFLAVIAVRGLAPFHFVAAPAPFNWVPFVPMLSGDWQSLAGVLLEKTFYYGTAIWLLRASGLKWMPSVIAVAAVLASIEIVQIHLPGRVPETTDPVLAILLGFVLAILSRETGKRFRSAE
jgi:VanZ family protein